MNGKDTSMGKNMVLNVIQSVVNAMLPLLTYPYLLRVLGAENMGRSTFAVSVTEYFVLLANLGIMSYAVREGSVLRSDHDRLRRFLDQVYTIHLAAAVLSTLLYLAAVFAVPKLYEYRSLLLILSPTMILNALTIDYVNFIREDFPFMALRTLILKAAYITALFVFVRTDRDLEIYVFCGTVWYLAQAVWNRLRAGRTYRPSLTGKADLGIHLKPVFTMFGRNVTTTLYVNSDITLLGLLSSDFTVGIYSLSVKIYTLIRFVLSAIPSVSTPRLSELWGNGEQNEFVSTAEGIYALLLTLALPAVVGTALLRDRIVLIAGGAEYAPSAASLLILSAAVLFGLLSWFWVECILMPMHMEREILFATAAAAAVNIALNLLLIPVWREKAAALTTVVSECIVFMRCRRQGRRHVQLQLPSGTIPKVSAGCVLIAGFVLLSEKLISGLWICLAVQVAGSVLLYFASQYALGNGAVLTAAEGIRNRIYFMRGGNGKSE